jgi:hypothetical protein
MLRLVQLESSEGRRVAAVEDPQLRLLHGVRSVYELANLAIAEGNTLSGAARERLTSEWIDYDSVCDGCSPWRLLPAIDHPEESARCTVSGTGLTHLGSAQGRNAMHSSASGGILGATKVPPRGSASAAQPAAAKAETAAEAFPETLTDSMRMFRSGIQGGRPTPGEIGTAPEWFYKGSGTALRAHGEPLEVPAYAEDGGEEAEVAGIYLIGPDGVPRRVGMAAGNEFSDHEFEKKNYLHLAGSKLRNCALGPELIIDPDFRDIPVEVKVERGGKQLWAKSFRTGEAAMCHSLQNIEHHHFKFAGHRRPGDVHVHFFGTASLSFGDGVRLQDGDVMQVAVVGFGRPLRNPLRLARSPQRLVTVIPMK